MSIHAIRSKIIKMNVGLLVFNGLVSTMQAFFLYNNLTDGHYWRAGLNFVLVILNGYVAWTSWKTVKQLKEEEKQSVWRILAK